MSLRATTLILIAMTMATTPFAQGGRAQPGDAITRVAFGSCAMQWLEQPIWSAVMAVKPDVFLFIGDAIYGDWDGEKVVPATAFSLRRDWETLAAIPGYANLRATVPVMATWDNHDYGKHNGGAEFELKDASATIFLDAFGVPSDAPRRQHPGIYDAHILGPPGKRVQIILLDTRYFKGPFVRDERSKEEKQQLGIVGKYLPNDDPLVTLLGGDQWRWLEAQLREPADLRLIVSSTQIVADEKGMDEWGNYPLERQRLFDIIEETAASGVILLSGNVHFAEISRADDTAYPLLDFTSSGLTHVNKSYAEATNSQRVAGPYSELNFGVIHIDWDKQLVTLLAVGVEGEMAFAHEVSIDELTATPQEAE